LVRLRPVEVAICVRDVAVQRGDRRVDQLCHAASPFRPPTSLSKYGALQSPYLKVSSGPPGACMTPSSVRNVLTIIFLMKSPPSQVLSDGERCNLADNLARTGIYASKGETGEVMCQYGRGISPEKAPFLGLLFLFEPFSFCLSLCPSFLVGSVGPLLFEF